MRPIRNNALGCASDSSAKYPSCRSKRAALPAGGIAQRGVTLNHLVSAIDSERQENSNLSSAIRLFVLDYFKRLALELTGEPRSFDQAQGLAGLPN
jgi:hypothetical protein